MSTSHTAAPLAAKLFDLAGSHGSDLAVVDGGRQRTFSALGADVRAFADDLANAGIGPGDRVGMVIDNSLAFVVAIFGIWSRGALAVPWHVKYRDAEILGYARDAAVTAIVAHRKFAAQVLALQQQDAEITRVWFFEGDDLDRQCLEFPRDAVPGADRLAGLSPDGAVFQYSTGSTGKSKRVTRTHDQFIRERGAVGPFLSLGPGDRVLGVSPFFHSYGLANSLLFPLLSGATVHVVRDFFPRDVARMVADRGITGIPGVPFMYQLLADQGELPGFTQVRYALSAGAPLSRETADVFERKAGIQLRQLYGSTETGVITVEPAKRSGTDLTVGRPIPGVSVAIQDERGRVVPTGEVGQVVVTSAYVVDGYDGPTGRGESSIEHGQFRPGDLGFLREDGCLTLVGRKRQFVNVGGNKVDPSEVERVLRGLPQVQEAVVVGLPDGAAGEKLKAVLQAPSTLTRAEVLEHCRRELADFKLPRMIEFRDEIPKSPLGKILRKYLLDEQGGAPGHVFDASVGWSTATGQAGSAAEAISGLPPILRVLLTIDGPVRPALEAWFWEPIEADVLMHAAVQADRSHPALGVGVGDPIVTRQVLLRGTVTGSVYAWAETIVAEAAAPPEVRERLADRQFGLGDVLQSAGVETRRRVSYVSRATAGDHATVLQVNPEAAVTSRTCIVLGSGQPFASITEIFAVSRFDV